MFLGEDHENILCSKVFPDWANVFTQLNHLHTIGGIQKALPYDPSETQNWKRHWIFPLLISAAVNMASLVLLIHGIKPNTQSFDYFILAIIPTVLSFGTAAFKLEH